MPKYFTMNSKDYMKYNLEELLENVSESERKNPKIVEILRRIASEKHPCTEFQVDPVRATPLVEVFGVIINRYEPIMSNKSLKISGTIQATNVGESETIVDLYNRGDENPESICLGGFLSLTGPRSDDHPILPSHDTKLKVHLKDITHGKDIEIARGTIDISFKALDDSEVVKVGLVGGKYGSVAVLYATFYSAVVAKVDIQVLFKGNEEDSSCGLNGLDLYGSVIARYCNKYGYSNNVVAKDIQRKCLSRVLFKKSRNQSEHVGYGSHIGLCNSMVAVPAYSSLVIELDLLNSDNDLKIVQDRVEMIAMNIWSSEKDLEGRDCVVRVIANWCLPDMLLSPERLHYNTEGSNISGDKEKSSTKEQPRRHQQLSHQVPTVPGITQRMEVFSIFIGHDSYKELRVYGRIVVFDSFGKCSIFKRDKNRPYCLSPSRRTISIGGCHEAFEGCHAGMAVNLKDINGGLTIQGCCGWDGSMLDDERMWYDKRICSIIQGKGGYAAFHYTIFSDAVQARVRASINAKDTSHVYPEVYGTLVAQYTCCNYSTSYETKYYRTTLYDKPPGNGLELHGHGRLLLLKPAITVPVNSSLIIDVDLYVGSSPGLVFGERNNSLNGTPQDVEHFRASKELKYGVNNTCQNIKGKCYDVNLTIIWG